MINISKIHIDYMQEPEGITKLPQIGWVIESDLKSVKQVSYRYQLASDKEFSFLVKDSEWVDDEESAHIYINNVKLESAKKYFIRVRIIDNNGETSPWSEETWFTTGIFDADLWSADFISGETEEDLNNSKGSYLRGSLNIKKEIAEAYVYASALGLYQLYINDSKVGDHVLAPDWTTYHKRLLYQTYDVSSYIQDGINIIGAQVGPGWYKGLMGISNRRNNYGKQTGFICQLHIRYADGSKEVFTSDDQWLTTSSPVTFAEIYNGEIYDARKELIGWSKASYDVSSWQNVTTIDMNKNILFSQPGSTIKEIEVKKAVSYITTPKGEHVIDFGQNMAGYVRFIVNANKGDIVELDCFESLDSEGNVYKDNLRKAKQKIYYTCRGDKDESYNPNFTFMGFRYVQIMNYPGDIDLEKFEACVVHSDMERTGFFECSNPVINQLQSNILWGMKSNFLGVPTDCPQRDERLGWTGDAQIFCRTASFLMNTHQFFTKWLKDLAADQTEEGGVPHVIPDIISGVSDGNWLLAQGTHSAAAWSDAAVINPWVLYLTFGDLGIIRDQYTSMKGWIDFMFNHAKGCVWSYKLQFGDWVALDAEEGSFFGATPTDFTASAYYAYSTRLFAKMAKAIGNMEDFSRYNLLADEIVKDFHKTYFDEAGQLTAMTQTAHVVALYFKLVPEEFEEGVINKLVELIAKENGHLVTGFVGTPYICHALSGNGRVKDAYSLLLKDDFPSWLYQVKMGATTIWEHWDGIKEDGSMWSPGMNSFNHYAYGAIGEWLYRVVAGLEIDEDLPGYKHGLIQPKFGGGLNYVKASYETVYGKLSVEWKISKGKDSNLGYMKVLIPHNTTASISLDFVKQISETDGIEFDKNNDVYKAQVGSGSYRIRFELKK